MPLTCHYTERICLELLTQRKQERHLFLFCCAFLEHTVISIIRKIGVIAQPLQLFPFETQTVEGSKEVSSFLVTINCGLFTPASTEVTG